MPLFYKGIGAGTHHHATPFPHVGLTARNPGGTRSTNAVISHICRGTTTTPFISLSRSYGVAEMYAYAGQVPPTQAMPGHVWEIEINDPAPRGVIVIDPVHEISQTHRDPLAPMSYQHDGDQTFLLGVVDPNGGTKYLRNHVRQPGDQNGHRTPNLTNDLHALVLALRDAEVMVIGTIPQSCFINSWDVW
jgi:hypothetical protein